MCGGTPGWRPRQWRSRGLSPRVRGNPAAAVIRAPPDWSIPACAGEPKLWKAIAAKPGVYPRVCGGTPYFTIRRITSIGLSPRVRGNPSG